MPSLRETLRADLLARHPQAPGWGAGQMALAFLVDPSLQAVLTVRLVLASRGRLLFLWRSWTISRYRMEIYHAEIGAGLRLPHPFNIILARGTRLGRDVTLFHNVTIGYARAPRPGERLPSPEIGDGVVVGPGCVVAGDIRIGDGARLAPGAYVTRDVPAGVVVEAPR